MTSVSRIISEIELDEEAHVDRAIAADRIQATDKIRYPLLSEMDWEKFIQSANPPGALAPSPARDTLTRQAIRRKEAQRKARRAGLQGLVRAIA